jgi:PadR family transcriptional regulator, regulatory protein PadR
MARRPNISRQTAAVFAAMLEQPRHWHYGYDLSKQTGLKSGTLYPLLLRLSDGGLLEAKWLEPKPPGKPPRHAYRLTAKGLAFARSLPVQEPARRIAGARA